MALKYGGWHAEVPDATNVMWWKTLSDAPEALLTFLYCCMSHFDDAKEVFKLTNMSLSGKVSRSEFEKMIAKRGWADFENDPEWGKQVFRLLDPDNSGDICFPEWCALQYLWNELELCILEFLRFLSRNFAGDFDMAWGEIEDGQGDLDLFDWDKGVQLVGYWGHSTPMFYYAAEGDNRHSVMTKRSWDKLTTIWHKQEELLEKIHSSEPTLTPLHSRPQSSLIAQPDASMNNTF